MDRYMTLGAIEKLKAIKGLTVELRCWPGVDT
jgi:hypothetical protein